MSTQRTRTAALRTPARALIAADFVETRFAWPLVIGVSGANLATGALIAAFVNEPVDFTELLQAIPLNWAFTWAIFLLVTRIIEAAESTASTALAGADLRLQNRVSWTVHLVYAFIAAALWAVGRSTIPGSDGLGIAHALGGRSAFDGGSGPLVPLEALALFLALLGVGAIGSVIGHAFRVGRARGGIVAISVYVAWLFDCGMVLASMSTSAASGALEAAILVIALVVPLVSIPLAWLLSGRGPIRTVG